MRSPTDLLRKRLDPLPSADALVAYEAWWESEGKAISAAVDRAGTPWLKMFDRFGKRVDEVQFAPEYWTMLRRGYAAGAVWRAFETSSLAPAYLVSYITSFYDPGLCCPHTVSLATAVPVDKYAPPKIKERFLPPLLRKDAGVWQGATWMTEARGGSDLGASVETTARRKGDEWRLTGDKYFASNAGAELAVVAARPEGAPQNVRGLALFLVPRFRDNGELNTTIRRLKDKIATRSVPTGEIELRDSEAHLLGAPETGIYLILEVLNLSRVANSIGSVALAHRALVEAETFAEQRVAFGKPIAKHALMRRQIEERRAGLEAAFALAWEAVRLLDGVWRETPPYSDRHALMRLVAHLAKYWTAEFAVQTAKWAMEVHGGAGTLAENGVERLLREAMILAIWEGTSHRQILDGLQVMQRKGAHRLLFEYIGRGEIAERVERYLASPDEAQAEEIFRDLALFTADALRSKQP